MAFVAIVSHTDATSRALTNDLVALLRAWDADGANDGTADKKDLRMALAAVGLRVSQGDLEALFRAFDPKGSGRICIAALNRWMQQGASRMDRVHGHGVRARVAAATSEVEERRRLVEAAAAADGGLKSLLAERAGKGRGGIGASSSTPTLPALGGRIAKRTSEEAPGAWQSHLPRVDPAKLKRAAGMRARGGPISFAELLEAPDLSPAGETTSRTRGWGTLKLARAASAFLPSEETEEAPPEGHR